MVSNDSWVIAIIHVHKTSPCGKLKVKLKKKNRIEKHVWMWNFLISEILTNSEVVLEGKVLTKVLKGFIS